MACRNAPEFSGMLQESQEWQEPETDTMYDAHGFLLVEDVEAAHASERQHQATVLPRQQAAWADLALAPDLNAALGALMKTQRGRDRMKGLVRGGVPAGLRPRVWHSMSGASAKRSAGQLDSTYYAQLVASVDKLEQVALERERQGQETQRRQAGSRGSRGARHQREELLEIVAQIDKDVRPPSSLIPLQCSAHPLHMPCTRWTQPQQVGRTFPGHREIATAEGQARLRRVLRACE